MIEIRVLRTLGSANPESQSRNPSCPTWCELQFGTRSAYELHICILSPACSSVPAGVKTAAYRTVHTYVQLYSTETSSCMSVKLEGGCHTSTTVATAGAGWW